MDPTTIALTIQYLLKSAPIWLSALQETLLNKGMELAIDRSNNSVLGTNKKYAQQLQLALSHAIERGLMKFRTTDERDKYLDILTALSEYQGSETLAREAMKIFTIADNPDLVLLTETYNHRKRFRTLSQYAAYQDIDARPYLLSFFEALIAELYEDPLFHDRVSDVIKVRTALNREHTISQIVHIEQQEVFMGDKVEGNKPTVTNTTHIGSVTGQVHTGEGDINVGSFYASSGGAVSTKDDFLSALREFMAEVEASRQKGLPEETVDDTLTEVEAAVREAKKDTPKSNRIVERLNNAKSILIAGTGVATAASQLIPLIEGAIQSVGKIF